MTILHLLAGKITSLGIQCFFFFSFSPDVARKPRSLYIDSSSDYESVQSQTNTSPFFHTNVSAQQIAAKFEQRNKQFEPLPSLPPPPLPPHRTRPHPPNLAKLRGPREHSTSSHDYESVSSFEHGAMKRNVSDHDYAHIGPVPSLESLDESLTSPPYVPDGGKKNHLLAIEYGNRSETYMYMFAVCFLTGNIHIVQHSHFSG